MSCTDKKIILKRRETFSASHRLYNPELSDEENDRIYTKCARNHGHNYVLYVSITGEINPDTEMIIEYEEMKQAIHSVLDRVDHRYLNDLPEFSKKSTTVENFAQIIWHWLEKEFPENITIEEIELQETEKNSIILRNTKNK